MIKAGRLVVSRPMYAFDRSTWRPASTGYMVDAVWFKRKKGRLVATMGTYHPMVLRRDMEPTDGAYTSWVVAADDNRYGGGHVAQWDGEGLLCSDQPVSQGVAAARIAFLEAMLGGYPGVPDGFDGWWTFARGAAVR